MEAGGVLGGLVIGAFDIEGVEGDAALRVDAGKRDVEAVVVDGLGEAVEQADLVMRLDVDDGALHRELVIDLDRGREGGVQGVALRRVAAGGDFLGLGDNLGVEILVLDERGLDRARKGLHGSLALHDAAAGLDDIERVDGDVVGARDDLGAENVQAGHAEAAGQFVEEAGAVPGDDVHHREAAVEIVLPFDDGPERTDGVRLADGLEEAVDHLDVQGDFAGFSVEKIPLREQVEVGGDLILTDARNLF